MLESFIASEEFIGRQPSFDNAGAIPKSHIFSGDGPEDLAIFGRFVDLGAPVQPSVGFVTDFIGSRARISSLWKGCEHLDNKVLPFPIPCDYHADAVEWLGALQAALDANDRFTMMEFGAGIGPWLVIGATAALRRGIRRIALRGVEADPGRFALMQQNLIDNDLVRKGPAHRGRNEFAKDRRRFDGSDGQGRKAARARAIDPSVASNGRPVAVRHAERRRHSGLAQPSPVARDQ